MRILDQKNDIPLKRVLILLTPEEAKELSDTLKQLLVQPDQHFHVPDADFEREITLAIYTPSNLQSLRERIQLLVEQDK